MSPPAGGPAPDRVAVRAHQVGFGDCVLLSFGYPQALGDGREERHVLFDFGSTRWPAKRKPAYREIAQGIAQRTGGKLDVLVITHRHKDHIGGFTDNAAADTIAALQPSLVLRPWTEDPAAAPDATSSNGVGPASAKHVAGLAAAHAFAAAAATELAARAGQEGASLDDHEPGGAHAELAHLVEDAVKNKEAIDRIDALAAAGMGSYLNAGQDAGTDGLLPGVDVSVLGPPTVEQWPRVANQRENDPQYWLTNDGALTRMLKLAAAPPRAQRAAAAVEHASTDPGPVRWLVEQLEDQQLHSLLRIVRTFDDMLNNTSVILLFSTGQRRLLFPGDAQIENWSYTLDGEDTGPLREHLGEIDLYKVGHHGSRNATPRSLVARWRESGHHVASVMSTLPGVHGKSVATAVPRSTLITALEQVGTLFRTDTLPADQLFLDVGGATGATDPLGLL